jgi:two-component system, chemotaxis family, sensor kinase CheA
VDVPGSFNVESLLETFFEEAEEHLTAFERGLLELEARSDAVPDPDVIATIFRAAHSIKGSSGVFGLTDILSFTHALETVLDRLRNGETAYEPSVSAALLRSVDVLRALVRNARTNEPPPDETAEVKAALERIYSRPSEDGDAPPQPPASGDPQTVRRVEIRFTPATAFMSRGMDALAILRDIDAAGVVESKEADASRLPDLSGLDPESFYLSFRVILRTSQSDAELREIVSFVDDLCAFEVRGLASSPPARPVPPESPVAPEAKGARAAGAASAATTIRVSTEKIDGLLDLVGELVIAQAMIVEATRRPTADSQGQLSDALTAMERHTRELQERVMSIRMVPLSTVFRRLPRMVHDLAASIGKKVKLEVEGETTEIDKSMVEQLVDPLTHLVRNAVDHGLEPPADRKAAGKDEEGTIRLRAFHQGGNVVIEVTDDGRGINRGAVRAKAEDRGLIAPGAVLTDDQIHELIFQPGFSTAAVVSDISGRGVGMDVVKRNVESLNGSLSLSSEAGMGTQVRVRLPLTLAILEGLAVRVGLQTFVIPLLSVVESFRPTRNQVRSVLGSPDVIDVRGTSLPIVRLCNVFGIPGAESDPCATLLCVVESNGRNLAVVVDEVLGQHQVVVKSLERNFRKVDGLMGATILGDGRVAMIVDVLALSRSAAPTTPLKRGQRSVPPKMEAA